MSDDVWSIELYVGIGVEIGIGLPSPDIQGENDRRRSRTVQYNGEVEARGLECYENTIDLLDFEDVFEYFDETESLVEQPVESVSLPSNILKGSLAVENGVELELG